MSAKARIWCVRRRVSTVSTRLRKDCASSGVSPIRLTVRSICSGESSDGVAYTVYDARLVAMVWPRVSRMMPRVARSVSVLVTLSRAASRHSSACTTCSESMRTMSPP
jgi:hypothetical protein